MPEIFMRDPQSNTLAVLVLIALIIVILVLLRTMLKDEAVDTHKGWYAWLLPAFTLLGIPAVLNLIQTTGVAFIFAVIVFIVILLNIIVPILGISGKSSHSLVNDW